MRGHAWNWLLLVVGAIPNWTSALRTPVPSPQRGDLPDEADVPAGVDKVSKERRQKARTSFSMNVRGKVGTLSLPWLRTAWITNLGERQSFREALLKGPKRFGIRNDGGMWGGIGAFTDALALDVDPELAQRLASCQLSSMSGTAPGQRPWARPPGRPGRVWIFVNGETSTGFEFWTMMQGYLPPGDRGVILGNWWNETLESYESPEVISIWVPFASTSFAERRHHSPRDLWDRSRRTRFDAEREYMVAYQQQDCNPARDLYWDRLNAAMLSGLNGTRGTAIGKCNGLKGLGNLVHLPKGYDDGPYPHGSMMDASVGRYEHFRFAFTAEHGEYPHGYITEKIVNGFLAGTVPIFFGAPERQVRRVFLPGTYIQASEVDPGLSRQSIRKFLRAATNRSEYESLLHRSKPLVSRQAIEKFFSWHPDAWPLVGDGLRTRILKNALKLCHHAANTSTSKL